MKSLSLDALGITIQFNPENTAGANISSDMPAPESEANKEFNAAVNGLESTILAHFCAGLNIAQSAYLDGIKVSYEAICNQYDAEKNDSDDDLIIITDSRRIKAAVDEQVDYEVNKSDWEQALESAGDEELALESLKEADKAKRTYVDTDVVEVIEEFERSIFA